jgi:hypothetical protein
MYYVTLKKIESTHSNVRTDQINGLATELPVVGQQFFMYSSEVLTEGTNVRHIHTSEIKDVKVDAQTGEIVFRTQNSLYALTNIKRADPSKETT